MQGSLAASPLPSHTNRPFPRGTVNRSTFHSGQTRRTYNGPGSGGSGLPQQSQDTSSVSGRQSFFSKLSSKFSKRCAALALLFCSRLCSSFFTLSRPMSATLRLSRVLAVCSNRKISGLAFPAAVFLQFAHIQLGGNSSVHLRTTRMPTAEGKVLPSLSAAEPIQQSGRVR